MTTKTPPDPAQKAHDALSVRVLARALRAAGDSLPPGYAVYTEVPPWISARMGRLALTRSSVFQTWARSS